MAQLFALVTEALAGATYTLLNGRVEAAQAIIDADQIVDDLTNGVVGLVWGEIDSVKAHHAELRHLVNLLLIHCRQKANHPDSQYAT